MVSGKAHRLRVETFHNADKPVPLRIRLLVLLGQMIKVLVERPEGLGSCSPLFEQVVDQLVHLYYLDVIQSGVPLLCFLDQQDCI